MSWAEVARLGAEAADRRREQERKDPTITKRWSRVVPPVVGWGVGVATGSPHAGHAASLGASAALERNPKLAASAGEFTRDIAHATGISVLGTVLGLIATPILIVGLPAALIHDSLVGSKDKWLS